MDDETKALRLINCYHLNEYLAYTKFYVYKSFLTVMKIPFCSTFAFALVAIFSLPIFSLLITGIDDNSNVWSHLSTTVLPVYLENTMLLMLGVGLGTLIIGVGTGTSLQPGLVGQSNLESTNKIHSFTGFKLKADDDDNKKYLDKELMYGFSIIYFLFKVISGLIPIL